MRRLEGAREAAFAGAIAALAVLALLLVNPGGIGFAAREAFFDKLLETWPRQGADTRIVLVDIDSETLKRHGAWPWRRERLAQLVERLSQAKPRVIALDILLEGRDRIGPNAMLRDLAESEKKPELATLAAGFPDDDMALAKAIEAGTLVVLALAISRLAAPPAVRTFPPLVLASAGEEPIQLTPLRVPAIVGPPASLFDAAAGLGVASFDTDADGWVRRFPLLYEAGLKPGGALHAGLAVETLRAAEGAGAILIDPRSQRFEIGERKFAAAPDSLMRFYPRPAQYWDERTLPAWRVLAGEKPLPAGAGETIFMVGSSAPEVAAYLPSAILGAASTLRLQGEALDLLQSGVHLQRLPGEWRSEYAMAIAAVVLVIAFFVLLSPALAAALTGLVLLVLAAGSILAFTQFRILADPVPAITAILAAAGLASLALFNRSRANRTLIEARFSRYMDPAVVEILAREPERLRIAAQRREVTAIFTDLEGFTSFSERTPPADLIATLDVYFEMLAAIIVDHGGMVDKIVGDAIHAFFNMPLDQADHAERAVRCARAMHAATENFRNAPRQKALALGRTRIGVDTGWASVGDVGGRNKLDYTAHGEAVNRAARLQGLAREVESGVLIGSGTVAKLPTREGLRSVGEMTPRGLSQAQEVFTFA